MLATIIKIELNLLSKPHAVLRYGALSERYRFEKVATVDYAKAPLFVFWSSRKHRSNSVKEARSERRTVKAI